ncbi:diacylglycerol/lipid kinase family protein [Methylocystis parvus]|uniref:diacylglycerol/lipid kinase family protein n=1 Tax=Methylocystis parvus TaxID=134 RepID=UPI003C7186CE
MNAETERPAGKDALRKPPESFLVIVNPSAGGDKRRLAKDVAARLTKGGRSVSLEIAAGPGEIRRLAEAARADAVLVAGGDGSINEAVCGLLARPTSRPALGVIPQGTVNVLMRELGLPEDASALADIFLRGETKPLHIGRANGAPFLLMASAGLDAAVVETVDLGLKRKIGRLAYAVSAAKVLARGGFPDVEAQTEAGVLRAKCVVVSNAKHYGGGFVIDRSANVTRPGLSLVALTEISPRATLALMRYFLTGALDGAGCVRKLATRRVTIRGEGAAQIDGDYLGRMPVEICAGDETLDILA